MNANLLTDAVFGALTPEGVHRRLSLPALLAALGHGDVAAFTGTQRHQVDAFHMFLCYLAAAALDRAGESDPLKDEDFWRRTLRELSARNDDCAWALVVDDVTQPAFMQPPVYNHDLQRYKPKAGTPDELDVLQTAKNHDLKRSRLTNSSIEDWALALVSLQTMSGFAGRDTYGISRMNSGYGSRVCVGTYLDLQPSARWREDIQRLPPRLAEMTRPPWPYTAQGHILLWLLPWDGRSSLGLDALHPFYVEICRPIRLTPRDGGLQALSKPTKVPRIAVGKELAGNVGDAWTPVRRQDNAALTPSYRGFHPELLRDLIITQVDCAPAAMQKLPEGDGSAIFHASVLVRGMGTTDGFHEANVLIDAAAKRLLQLGGAAADRLGRRSQWAIDAAGQLRRCVLRPALFSLFEGGPDGWPDTNRREPGQWALTWLNDYDRRWSDDYFPWLWRSAEIASDEQARAEWLNGLSELASNVLERAIEAAPQRTGRRYRARVRASGLFHGMLNKHFQEEMADVRN